MIVKDEADVLPRLFASCRELIDYWVICDTGSTDGTQALIRRELEGVPGELHQRTWVDFGVNRSELMELARGKSDYLLLLDADMTLGRRSPLPPLTKDAYLLRHAGEVEYAIPRLVRGDRRWRYDQPTHEYLVGEGAHSEELLGALVIEHHADGGARAEKFQRDAELLEREVNRRPDDPRATFYLAQTYRDMGEDDRAAELYQRRAQMPGWAEETYFAHYQIGVLAERRGDWPRAADAYMRAWEVRPQRLEALHALTVGLRERGCYQAAHRFTSMASHLKPLVVPADLLFVTPRVYEWGMLFEYSITSYWVGEYGQSVAACKRLLSIKGLPGEYRRLTIANLQHAVRECARFATASPRALQHVGTPTRGRSAPAAGDRLADSEFVARLAGCCGLAPSDVDRQLLRPGKSLTVNVERLGGASIRLRPGTSDVLALERVCAGALHLPDPPLHEPQLILDVGAGIGLTSVHLAHVYPTARMVVVESDPDDLELCAENLRPLRDRTMLIEAVIKCRAGSTGGSLAELTLDNLLERAAGGVIVDYLKLDVGDLLGVVLGEGGVWVDRVRRLHARVAADSAVADALNECHRLGFRARGSGDWIIATRTIAGPAERRRLLRRYRPRHSAAVRAG